MGDSAALFAHVPPKRKVAPEVQALTEDHRLTNPSERRRLAGIASLPVLDANQPDALWNAAKKVITLCHPSFLSLLPGGIPGS